MKSATRSLQQASLLFKGVKMKENSIFCFTALIKYWTHFIVHIIDWLKATALLYCISCDLDAIYWKPWYIVPNSYYLSGLAEKPVQHHSLLTIKLKDLKLMYHIPVFLSHLTSLYNLKVCTKSKHSLFLSTLKQCQKWSSSKCPLRVAILEPITASH